MLEAPVESLLGSYSTVLGQKHLGWASVNDLKNFQITS